MSYRKSIPENIKAQLLAVNKLNYDLKITPKIN